MKYSKSEIRNLKLKKFKICNFQFSIFNSQTGVTLIEVLVAIVILIIGLLGVAMLQYMAIGGNAFGREMQIATEVAQERLEIIKSVSYANVVSGQPPMTDAGTYWWLSETLQDADPSKFGGLTFTRITWAVDNCINAQINDPNPNTPLCNPIPQAVCGAVMNNMRAVAARVCWVDKNGGNHSVTLNGVMWDETATP